VDRRPGKADLGFENWPLVEPETVAVDHIRVVPFLRDNGTVLKASGLKQEDPATSPTPKQARTTQPRST